MLRTDSLSLQVALAACAGAVADCAAVGALARVRSAPDLASDAISFACSGRFARLTLSSRQLHERRRMTLHDVLHVLAERALQARVALVPERGWPPQRVGLHCCTGFAPFLAPPRRFATDTALTRTCEFWIWCGAHAPCEHAPQTQTRSRRSISWCQLHCSSDLVP